MAKLGTNSVKSAQNTLTQIQKALLGGMAMSAAAVLGWFMLSRSAHSIALMLLVFLSLTGLDTLGFFMLRGKAKPARGIACGCLVLLNLAAFCSATVYVLAPSQLFYPHFDEQAYAQLKLRPQAEELEILSDGGVISGWLLHNAPSGAPLVLYFCGNGENAAARGLKLLDGDSISAFEDCNFAVFDYPGYGKSDGSPSEKALKTFGLGVFDALARRPDVEEGHIILFGYSLGTGVACYVASEREADGLMLMAPYADGYDLYNGFAPVFHGPLRLLVAFKMESVCFAERVAVSPLILASTGDEMVPYDSSVRLSRAFPAGSALKTLEGIGHNDFWDSPEALGHIAEYLKKAVAE